jgi:hypothetical protein
MDEIRVEMDTSAAGSGSYDLWLAIMYKRLKDAGVPVREDLSVESGTLHRLDDPADFGKTLWVWTPPR